METNIVGDTKYLSSTYERGELITIGLYFTRTFPWLKERDDAIPILLAVFFTME